MNYDRLWKQVQAIQTTGEVVVPPGYEGETNFIIPDEIVNFCINRYKLVGKNINVLDPMCGIGTIPRIINAQGGNCLGVEINEARLKIASQISDPDTLLLGNFLETSLPEHNFQCIFTSMPFDWFKENNFKVKSDFANRFKQLLKQKDGFVLLDSVPKVNRDGLEWLVAKRQCEYLEENGFTLTEITKFNNAVHADSTSDSVIMKFIL